MLHTKMRKPNWKLILLALWLAYIVWLIYAFAVVSPHF